MIARVPRLPIELQRAGDDELVLVSGAAFGLTELRLVFPVGACADGPRAGLAAMTWEMSTRGTRRLDRGDFAEALEVLGAELDFAVHAYSAYVTLRVLDEHLDRAIDLLGDALVDARDDAGELRELDEETAESIDVALEGPDGATSRSIPAALWDQAPWNTPVDGTRSTRRGITPARVAATRRAIIGAPAWFGVGAEDPTRALSAVERLRARIREAGGAPADMPMRPPRQWGRGRIVDFDAPQGALVVLAPAPAPSSPAWAAVALHATWFGDGFSSPLVQALRARDGLSYDVSWWVHGEPDQGLQVFRCHPEAANVARALAAADDVWREHAHVPPDPRSLDRAKATYVGARLASLETVERRLAAACTLRRLGLDVSRLWELPREVCELSADDVAAAAAAYAWGTGDRTAVAALPGGVDAPQWKEYDFGLELRPASLDDAR